MTAVEIRPMRRQGPWTAGFVLDYHSFSAAPTDDPYHPFEMKRTELGELLYRFKYAGDRKVLGDIVDTMEAFVHEWRPNVNCIVPAPPSLVRKSQPVLDLARELASRLSIDYCEDAVRKIKPTESMKNVADWFERRKLLTEAIQAGSGDVSGKTVLLFDDLTQSGSTLARVADLLQRDKEAAAVYALTLTRTR